MKTLKTPISVEDIKELKVGDMVLISGEIFCGRDAVLPKICKTYCNNKLSDLNLNLNGSVIFHTAVSPAGVGPTSSNKFEIESSIGTLSEAGVRLHLGKGALSSETVKLLNQNNSVYAIIPPVTALLQSKIKSQCVKAFPEEKMEAFHLLTVEGFPAIIAAAHGDTIYR